MARYGQPQILNTYQGRQFTSEAFTGRPDGCGIRISMDGRGRVHDSIFVERLGRSVKYEEVYLNEYPSVPYARERIGAYFDFYNSQRPHQALEYATPEAVYRAG